MTDTDKPGPVEVHCRGCGKVAILRPVRSRSEWAYPLSPLMDGGWSFNTDDGWRCIDCVSREEEEPMADAM